MSGFVEEVRSICESLVFVAEELGFPWRITKNRVSLSDAFWKRSADVIRSHEPNPPFTRSLRDGYALDHANTAGASSGAPVFLRSSGEVVMGEKPEFVLDREETASIPTGGMLPEGADAVVMLEDTASAGGWIEIRKAVQRGENLMFAGEDIPTGGIVLERGELIDDATSGLMATLGIFSLDVLAPRIGILSTGDEVVSIDTPSLAPGSIRDANSMIVNSALRRYGFDSTSYGIIPDRLDLLEAKVREMIETCDVILLSGGSSVGMRDYTTHLIESFPAPGLLVRGINMVPGKPTLIGGAKQEEKLVIGLPGHPLSCLVATLFVVLPLLLRMCGENTGEIGKWIQLPLAGDVQGRTGSDEFIPMRLAKGSVFPLAAKSGYVSALRGSDGFIRMSSDRETLRRGEAAEVWIW